MESTKKQYLLIVVAALGYFVDIYDLILFGIVRVPSLTDLGVPAEELQSKGILLLNMQMAGMLLGGVVFGILGDIRGRVTVLFGSILLYSIANIANGLVTSIPAYAAIRFLAGLGLAGELGAGITLVSETMEKEKRGYGTMLVVFFGALGAVVAALVADEFSWRVSYFVGGGLGLLLLLLRVGAMESGMFNQLSKEGQKVGKFLKLITRKDLLLSYIRCILIGVPVWYVVGVLVVFSPEFAQVLGVEGEVKGSQSVIWSYVGLSIGDLLSGILSQIFKTRRKVIMGSLLLGVGLSALYLFVDGLNVTSFYVVCFLLGVSMGYWGLFVTVASETFGTNVRATVTTTVPNFVRGATVPITLSFAFLQESMGLSMIYSAAWVGLASFLVAIWASIGIKETYGKDLNYVEII
jgi:putative MFS transporter